MNVEKNNQFYVNYFNYLDICLCTWKNLLVYYEIFKLSDKIDCNTNVCLKYIMLVFYY